MSIRLPHHSHLFSTGKTFCFILCHLVFVTGPITADPPEGATPWPNPPQGFHLEMLGPNTRPVDLNKYASVLYVSVEKDSNHEGKGTRSAPWKTLKHALEVTGPGDREHPVAILVAKGRYTGTPLVLKPWIDLYGGHSPESWERNIFKYTTVLDGQGTGRVIIGADYALLDGFVVINGRIRGHGAGLFCERTSPTITNNIFRNNKTLTPEDFDPYSTYYSRSLGRDFDNTRRLRMRGHIGGAIGLVDFANPDIKNNLFISNTTEVGNGGSIGMVFDCIPEIGFNVFWGNRAGVEDKERTRTGNGGAISMVQNSRPAIMHNLFVANEALGRSDGGALYCEYFSNPEIRWNVFLDNFAEDDSAVLESQKYSRPNVYANLMYGNRVKTGVISQDESFLNLENNIIANNTGDGSTTAISNHHGFFRAVNNTIVYNVSSREDGAAIHHVNRKSMDIKIPIVQNNIIWGNRPHQVHLESDIDILYNIIEGDYPGYGIDDVDPGFIDDGKTIPIGPSIMDEAQFITTISLVGSELDPDSLQGRIVNIGKSWTLVKSNNVQSLVLWGLVNTEEHAMLKVLPTYHLGPQSGAIGKGVYPNYPPQDIDGDLRMNPSVDAGADEYMPR